jgi:hypothetical protein
MATALVDRTDGIHTPGLDIDVSCELPAKLQSAVDAFRAECADWESHRAMLFRQRDELLSAALSKKLGSLIDAGRVLRDRKAALSDELAALRWQRFDLIREIVPSAKEASQAALAEYEVTVALEMRRLIDNGAANGMPAARTNPAAAGIQLRHHVENLEPILASKGTMNDVIDEANALAAQYGIPPRPETCRVDWPQVSGFEAKVAELVGVACNYEAKIADSI